ncbi:hypothetical protein A33Q_1011 [Indibacter alkaliphilus LW1]|uniref:DUF4097 domain-containing protein n=1 Tax=Indibacter alkaliphilus (strain CCUG 57479 / KCTC 22604 / LW1) TaxID=1189612 RepID=S2DH49_INDAL|nr:DUF4097 family beta strand repeat-containing protein [Indibacter alkaliphilus]EOZ98357.1 hypothetical protein A33Q_1011 [Indibacter alkaliphilus LW1]
MTKHTWVQAVVMICSLLATACYFPENTEIKEYDETFSGVREIEVDGRFLEVSYEGRSGEKNIYLSAFLEVPEDRGFEVKYRQSGSKLKIELVGNSETIGWNFASKMDGFITLIGPEEIKLDLKCTSGSVDVMNVKHQEINLKANSGSVKLMGVEVETGNFSASSGSIRGEGISGELACKVNSGSIRLKDVLGDVKAKASSGSIKLEDVQGIADAQVNSGSIRLNNVRELGELKASSGSIRAENSGFGSKTAFHANSGSVKIETSSNLEDFDFDLSAGSGSLKVGDKSGSKSLKIDNNSKHTVRGNVGSGSIRISN